MEKTITERLYDRQTSEAFYDDRYSKGYMDKWPLEKRKRVLEVVTSLNLREEGEALDFGCGHGVFTDVLREALPRWQIYGTDFSNVAIQNAKTEYTGCTFLTASESASLKGKRFDFLFTHHVLEHVHDLEQVWLELMNYLKPSSSMLHVLPCGNENSLESRICSLRTDGIDPKLGNRFFFEDEGHVRRLSSSQLTAIAGKFGFQIAREYYASHYYGAIDWISDTGLNFVLALTDPAKAKDLDSRTELIKIRRKLVLVTKARDYVAAVEKKTLHTQEISLKQIVKVLMKPLLYPSCKAVATHIKRQSNREWTARKAEPNGSEMYLYFSRDMR